jgi:predicted nucleotidyltransferase
MLSSLFLTARRSLIKVKDTLNTDESMVYAGFALGFIHSCNDKNLFIENPLSSILIGAIMGFITSIGSTIVSSFVPARFRFIIPLAVTASCVNHILNPNSRKFGGFKLSINKVE